ncbi:LysR family transcriptional regulator [Chimaeribacter californicus]|uniref:LysR family transcriptional regulator n=1 Tax=Chimaeribacter californicus TaxID=2060067 RepID=A0A2N5DZQ3_9GAMM|nr:LysR family transcriptional regulator [Chimaeribacter californicus]PLR33324.1 LysR family transcriptional regulator [Chimaeribacter californicus]
MDSFTSLTSFVRTAETLSFVQAARTLGISASAVGKNVARLEKKLGVRLFNRCTRSVSLTAEGATLLARCQSILEQLREAEAELTTAVSHPTGTLRVSFPVIGYRLMLPLLPAFTQRYPGIDLDLDFSDRLVNVIDEGFDVAIRSGEIGDSRLTAKTLGHFRFVLCASPAYLQAYGEPRTPHDLPSHKCILFRFPSTGLIQAWDLNAYRVTGEFRALSLLTLNNIEAMVGAALSGLGICYVPDFVVREALKQGQLIQILPDYCDRRSHFSALWPASRYLSPRIRCFIDFLSEHWQ